MNLVKLHGVLVTMCMRHKKVTDLPVLKADCYINKQDSAKL